MEFFKKLLGIGQSGSKDDRSRFFYVKPQGCDEVVRVRVDMHNELSQSDDGKSYFVRKTARGTTYKCTQSAELYLTFNNGRRLLNTEITGGTLVDEATYNACAAEQAANNPAS